MPSQISLLYSYLRLRIPVLSIIVSPYNYTVMENELKEVVQTRLGSNTSSCKTMKDRCVAAPEARNSKPHSVYLLERDALLFASYSEPRLPIDLEDYVYCNQHFERGNVLFVHVAWCLRRRMSNVFFKELLGLIVTSPLCSPVHLHLG